MVVKMMRWRPWPPLQSRKYEVILKVQRLEGLLAVMGNCDWVHAALDKEGGSTGGLTVEIRWKGPKNALSTFRRTTVKKNCTTEESVKIKEDGDGPAAARDGNALLLVEWNDEEFRSICSLSTYKDNVFHPWEITFAVLFNGLNQGSKNKGSVVGSTVLNLAEFATKTGEELELSIPLALSGSTSEPHLSLHISLSLLELRAAQDSTESVQRTDFPVQSLMQSGDTPTPSPEKDELSALKAGLRKVKIFTGYASIQRSKKACREEEGSEGRCSAKSEEGDYGYPFDTDSLDDFDERESDEGKEDPNMRKSFSYGTLAYANFAGGSFYSNSRINGDDEDWIYYSNHKSDVGCAHVEDPITSVYEPSVLQHTKRSILPWRKRKLSFRSAKGEPLLKKGYGEEGGDDIDFDRRQLSSDESFSFWWRKTDEDSSAHRSSVSEFGDDNFTIGSWEQKEIFSRDGHLKLQTQVFFASIDQRSERAAGESACTALVAVIADWLQNNHDLMPIKSQFDSLIREGSLEWRNLCENVTYRERFPDKHFDLETVLHAEVRSLSVVPRKSFIGFFHPDGKEEERFDFLHGAMSFDNIWDEISHAVSDCSSDTEPQVYIVSWNDHFFVLKVEAEAYYIIDTLGERLYEGCNQAYILKFDRNTTIYKLPNTTQSSQEKSVGDKLIGAAAAAEPKSSYSQQLISKESSSENSEPMKSEEEEEAVVCHGKESCKEYIKSFLAAIPIRELQADIKKGLIISTPLHHRLQVEFHFTHLQQPAPMTPQIEEDASVMQQVVQVA